VADFLLRSGFMQTVTVLHAEFSTELVVILYSGWIVQLVNASFAWRTHLLFLSSAQVYNFIQRQSELSPHPHPCNFPKYEFPINVRFCIRFVNGVLCLLRAIIIGIGGGEGC
jgi:hypothetical protein